VVENVYCCFGDQVCYFYTSGLCTVEFSNDVCFLLLFHIGQVRFGDQFACHILSKVLDDHSLDNVALAALEKVFQNEFGVLPDDAGPLVGVRVANEFA